MNRGDRREEVFANDHDRERRHPTGAAKVLLKVAERHPKVVLEAAA